MDLSAIKRLLQSRRPSDEYIARVQGFLKFAYSGKKSDAKIQCPCVKCVNRQLQMQETVYEHLVCDGMLRRYTIWGCHGETSSYISANKDSESPRPSLNTNMRQVLQEAFGYIDDEHHTNGPHASGLSEDGPDAETQDFFDLLRAADEPLWEGYERFQLYATILHTVSDYLGTGILARYSVMGQLGCVSYEDETSSIRLKHASSNVSWDTDDFYPLAMSFVMMPIHLTEPKSIG
ncbi:unnamed protein product [Miscanthus lutarioriparius]|uniref:Transposase-associated domain-containing protein n=1 Tax=Miscanthus lutarioriparius TaxID=422564 RepID=A0A811MDH5_9POAL|nr:unnamed protein product [Miscanthus lutarioriparius]